MANHSQIRQNYHEECEALVNKQVNMELYASYVYTSMVREEEEEDEERELEREEEDIILILPVHILRPGRSGSAWLC